MFYERGLPTRSSLKAVVEFPTREDGPTAVEYAVMLALVVVVCIAAAGNQTFRTVGSTVRPSGGFFSPSARPTGVARGCHPASRFRSRAKTVARPRGD